MTRARDLGIAIGMGTLGPNNAITDVAGVEVGYVTLVAGQNVRTGVTVVVPLGGREALFAGFHRLNGNGEMTGIHYIRETGLLTSPIGITNTHSVGAVHQGLVAHSIHQGYVSGGFSAWALPVVAETYDGLLNDINAFHVKPEHVEEALADAHSGPIAEGSVGGGTGMICHGFKGGTGTSSRVLDESEGGYTVGVLVQANHGSRIRFQVDGVPVGRSIPPSEVPAPHRPSSDEQGSIIVVIATDAPLLPGQCDRLAARAALGIGRTGGLGENSSGDLLLAFSTGNRDVSPDRAHLTVPIHMVNNERINPLFGAVVEATEEAIVNAVLGAETMVGYQGATVYGLEPETLRRVMRSHGRLATSDSNL